MRALRVIAVLCLCWSSQVLSQSPEDSASSYFAALKASDIKALALAMHPDALSQFKSLIVPLLDNPPNEHIVPELVAFYGVKSVDELMQLSPIAFYSAFQSGLAKRNPDLAARIAQSKYQVLGHVLDGDLSHVVYRAAMSIDSSDISQVAVITLQRRGSEWGVLLSQDIKAMEASLRRAAWGNAQQQVQGPTSPPSAEPRP